MQLVTGFLLINCLSKEDYATFATVIAIQMTTGVLVEMGITSSLTGLIGKDYQNKEIVGKFLAASKYYRDRLLIIGGLVLLGIFYYVAPIYGWGDGLWFLLWLIVVSSLVFQAWCAIYGCLFLLHDRLKEMYIISVVSAVFRLAMIAAVYFAGYLSGPLALAFGALQVLIGCWGAYEFAKPYVAMPAKDVDLRPQKKAILGQVLPRVPSNLFYAFEGQIAIFAIGLLGATSNVAELGAISRLGMLFILFRRAGGIIVTPYFSKLQSVQVLPRALFFIFSSVAFCFLVSTFTYLLPEVPLLLLGSEYSHLKYEVFLMILASSLSIITITTFSICVGRKYIFPWFSIVDLGPVCTVMVAGFFIWDLSILTNALYYTIALAVAKLVSMIFIIIVGLSRDKEMPEEEAQS